jgi:hypothetical protein
VATGFTLIFVPVMYSLLRRQAPKPDVDDDWTPEGTTPPNNHHEHAKLLTAAIADHSGAAFNEPSGRPV